VLNINDGFNVQFYSTVKLIKIQIKVKHMLRHISEGIYMLTIITLRLVWPFAKPFFIRVVRVLIIKL